MPSSIHTSFIQRVQARLSSHEKERIDDSNLIPAAVAILLFQKNGRYHLIFNKRTQRVEHHKGEISFPGGAFDEEDGNLTRTVLRETWEEMGIRQEDITLLGELDDFRTSSRFKIAPFVGTFPYPYRYKASSIEVAEVLEVPIDHLMDPANQTHFLDNWAGAPRMEYTYRYGDHVIWGATARILHHFLTLIS